MKTILKTITTLFIISSFVLISCSKKDDDTTAQDPIIGEWIIKEASLGGEKETLTDCTKKNSITFKAGGAGSGISTYDDGDQCISSSLNLTWENKGDNKYSYTFTSSGETFTLPFSLANNLLTVDLGDGDYSVYTKK